jgi:hypothetical protein
MGSPISAIAGIVSKLLPTPFADDRDNDHKVRLSKYGELSLASVAPTRHQFADEGSYLLATNATIGTGFTGVTALTAFTDNSPWAVLFNNEQPGGKSIWLDFLKLIATAVGTSATAWHYAIILDQGLPTATTLTNATQVTPICPSSGKSPILVPTLYVQNNASTPTWSVSSAAKKTAARGVLGGLNIAGDEMLVTFGTTDVGAYPGTADAAGQPGRRVDCSPPVVIDPQTCARIYIWGVASAASISPEFELGMIAR